MCTYTFVDLSTRDFFLRLPYYAQNKNRREEKKAFNMIIDKTKNVIRERSIYKKNTHTHKATNKSYTALQREPLEENVTK